MLIKQKYYIIFLVNNFLFMLIDLYNHNIF